MFAYVPQDIEAGHRFHLDIGDDHLRLNAIELLDRFRRRIKWENLVTFFATKRHDHLYHRRLIIDDNNLRHEISGRRIFQF